MTKYALRQAYLPRYAFSSFDCVLCFVERHTRMLLHLYTFLWGCLFGKLCSSKWLTTWCDHHKVPAQFLYVFSFVQLLFGCNGNWKYILWTHNGDENNSWLGKVSHLDCSLSYIALLIQLLVVLVVKAFDQICIEADYLPRYAFSSFDCVLCFVERHTRMLLHLGTFLWGCLFGKLYSSKWMTTWSDHHKVPAQFLFLFSHVQLLLRCNGNWKYILWTHNGEENNS